MSSDLPADNPPPLSSRLISQVLKDWQRAGLTHVDVDLSGLTTEPAGATGHSTAPRTGVSTPQPVAQRNQQKRPAVPTENQRASVEPARVSQPAFTPAETTSPPLDQKSPAYPVPPELDGKKLNRTARTKQLEKLACQVAECTRCQELAEQRTQTVFGVGDPEAQIMFVGEAPGADEDKQGEPFVGRAGKLLNQIIEASQLKREELYICNILRCRPPGNRNPSPKEAENCREYLDGQIALVDPQYIICWGTVAAQNLLGNKTPIGKMRRKFHDYQGRKVLCTYHPSYLLRNPSAKKDVWEDMKLFMSELGVDLS